MSENVIKDASTAIVKHGAISFRITEGEDSQNLEVVMYKEREDDCGPFLKTLGTIPPDKVEQLFRMINAEFHFLPDPDAVVESNEE